MKNQSARPVISPLGLFASAGKRSPLLRTTAAAALLGLTIAARAQSPQGGQVVHGNATINQNGNYTSINAGNGAIINWQSFSIGQGQTVQFVQPGAGSRVLNRITGPDPSRISGTLLANGIVYIVNPAGVYFAHGSLVNVGGIYAAAGNISNVDFINGKNHFTGVSGTVENRGTINGGSASLVGRQVANYGAINAPNGMITMAAGSDVYIGEQGGQVFARVSGGGQSDTGVTQAGELNAAGGQVVLGAGDMYAVAIDHPGRTKAKNIHVEGGQGGVVSVSGTLDASNMSAGGTGGKIEVLGDKVGVFGGTITASGDAGGGTVHIGGDYQGQGNTKRADATYVSSNSTISADAVRTGNGGQVIVWSDRYTNFQGKISAKGGSQSGNGGFVETSGKKDLYMSGRVDASAARGHGGTWLLDPTDVTLSNAVTSGGSLGGGVFTPGNNASANVNLTEITNALSSGTSVTINTTSGGGGNGDITLVDPLLVSMTGGAATLTLNAVRDIAINSTLTGTGTTNNALGLSFNAGRDVTIGSAISINGGNFAINAAGVVSTTATIATGGGSFNIANTGSNQLGADINAGTGDVTIGGATVLTADITISGNDLTFNGTVDSDSLGTMRDLTLNSASSGVTRFNANVGATADLDSLTTNADGSTVFGAQFVKGMTVTFNDPVRVDVDAVVRGLTSVTFNSTVDSQGGESNNLIVNSPLSTFNGSVGNLATDTFMGIIQTNAAGTTTINAPFVKGEVIEFQDAVVLGADAVIRGSTSVTFQSTVDSEATEANDLIVNSPITVFNGNVGNAAVDTILGIIQTNSTGNTTLNAQFLKGTVVNIQDALMIGVDAVIKGTTSVTFGSVVDSEGGEANDLIVNSPLTTFSGDVGNSTAGSFFGLIQTNAAGTTTLNAQFMKGTTINIEDNLVLGVDAVIRGTTAVTFGGTIDSETSEGNDLIVNSALTTFNGDVGLATGGELGLLQTNTTGTTLINAAQITANIIEFQDQIVIGAGTTVRGMTSVTFHDTVNSESGEANDLQLNTPNGTFLGEVGTGSGGALGRLATNPNGTTTIQGGTIIADVINFQDDVILGTDTTVTGATSITFAKRIDSEAGEANDLTVNSPLTQFGGRIGDSGVNTALGALTTNPAGTTTIATDVVNAGTIVFNDAVVIAADTTINATASITFASTLDSEAAAARSLTINSPLTRFDGRVGNQANDSALGRVATDVTGTTILNTDIFKCGSVEFADGLVIATDATITAASRASFQAIDSESGEANDLAVNATTAEFNATLGAGTGGELGALSTDEAGTSTFSAAIRAASVNLADTVNFNGGTINTTGDQTFGVLFIGADTILTGANLAFNGTINSGLTDRDLTLNTSGGGTTIFNAAIGTTNPLKSLTTNADGRTVFAGGQIITGGDMTFNDKTIVASTANLSGNNVLFNDTVDSDGTSARALNIDTTGGGTTTFQAAVGGTNPLLRLTTNADGTTRINGGSVTTVNTQAYNDDTVLGADTTLAGSNIAFGGTLNSDFTARALTLNSSGNGDTTFSGAVGNTAPLATITTNADGTTRFFGGSVRTTGDQTYNDAVRLAADLTVTGNDINFQSTLDSGTITGGASLTINTIGSGVTTFNGVVGAIQAIVNLTTNADGKTRIGANVNTSGGSMIFGDQVLLFRDAVLTDVGTKGITFSSTIDSEGSARALSLITSIDSNATAGAPSIARINFGGNIGSTLALSSLRLGGDRTTIPTVGTIVAGLNASNSPIANFSLTITTTGAFTMGALQKMTVIGNLTINSGGAATLSDISTLGNLAVSAPSIALRTRSAGSLLGLVGNTFVTISDSGTDFVSGGTINFSTAPTVLGGGSAPSFATSDSTGISATLSALPQRSFGRTITAALMQKSGTYLDLRASGPSNVNFAVAIAGALPSESQSGVVVDDTGIGRAEREELNQLGIRARSLDEKQLLEYLLGRSLVTDAPARTDPSAADYLVSINRLPSNVVRRVLETYRDVFWKQSYDPATGKTTQTPQPERVGEVLSAAWAEYSKAAGAKADTDGFRAYVEAVPAQAEALNYLNGLRELFGELGYLGLSPAENRIARNTIIRSITVKGLTPAQLEATIMSRRLGTGA